MIVGACWDDLKVKARGLGAIGAPKMCQSLLFIVRGVAFLLMRRAPHTSGTKRVSNTHRRKAETERAAAD